MVARIITNLLGSQNNSTIQRGLLALFAVTFMVGCTYPEHSKTLIWLDEDFFVFRENFRTRDQVNQNITSINKIINGAKIACEKAKFSHFSIVGSASKVFNYGGERDAVIKLKRAKTLGNDFSCAQPIIRYEKFIKQCEAHTDKRGRRVKSNCQWITANNG